VKHRARIVRPNYLAFSGTSITNGVWYRERADLEQCLSPLAEAGRAWLTLSPARDRIPSGQAMGFALKCCRPWAASG
jgi:hypothetical protein